LKSLKLLAKHGLYFLTEKLASRVGTGVTSPLIFCRLSAKKAIAL
jgi:hypothetical protein